MSCSFAFPIEIGSLDSQTVHVGFIDTIVEGGGASVLEGVGDGTLLGDVVVDKRGIVLEGVGDGTLFVDVVVDKRGILLLSHVSPSTVSSSRR